MTFANSTPTQDTTKERNVAFAAAGTLYQLHPDASRLDVLDQLNARLSQLNSMLTLTHGIGFETFNAWDADTKENYLWSCDMLAKECKALVRHL